MFSFFLNSQSLLQKIITSFLHFHIGFGLDYNNSEHICYNIVEFFVEVRESHPTISEYLKMEEAVFQIISDTKRL